jgi:hypothetical protein
MLRVSLSCASQNPFTRRQTWRRVGASDAAPQADEAQASGSRAASTRQQAAKAPTVQKASLAKSINQLNRPVWVACS